MYYYDYYFNYYYHDYYYDYYYSKIKTKADPPLQPVKDKKTSYIQEAYSD